MFGQGVQETSFSEIVYLPPLAPASSVKVGIQSRALNDEEIRRDLHTVVRFCLKSAQSARPDFANVDWYPSFTQICNTLGYATLLNPVFPRESPQKLALNLLKSKSIISQQRFKNSKQ